MTNQQRRISIIKQRRISIIKQLSDLSRDGWSNARPCDYEPLEAELRALGQSVPITSAPGFDGRKS